MQLFPCVIAKLLGESRAKGGNGVYGLIPVPLMNDKGAECEVV